MFNLARRLQTLAQEQRYRRRQIVNNSVDKPAEVHVAGRKLLNFASNDYLGLATHPEVVSAFSAAAQRHGVGSGASHLITGHSSAHHELEEALADFTGRARALLFSSGYQANLGVFQALLERGDASFHDKLNHASLVDAGLLSRAEFKRYGHLDMAALERQVESSSARRKLIVSDGVFSMDGDCAPLTQLVKLAREQSAWLMIDDAHGFGVLGKTGGGLAEEERLGSCELPVLMATLGKALGVFGAFVAGDEDLIETLIQKSRSYVYTTALPPAIAAAGSASLKLLVSESWRRERLANTIEHFSRGAKERDLPVMPSRTAIQPLMIGDEAQALATSRRLREVGFMVTAIRPPTVPEGTARLRIALSAAHRPEDVEQLLDALAEIHLTHEYK